MADIDPAIVLKFLQANFHRDVASVQWIGSGWFSHAFSFTVGERAFIFRVNSYLEDLQKDAFAYQHFASARLPIPRVIFLGRFDETRHFCITERCSGQTLNDMDKATVRKVVPRLFETLDAIHRVDVSDYTGWGLTDANGNGRFDSWTDHLLSLYNQKFIHRWSLCSNIPFGSLNWQEPAERIARHLGQQLTELTASNLAWLIITLRCAGVLARHTLVDKAASLLEQNQHQDGCWPSEDGADWDVHATLEALRALRLCGRF